MEILRQWFQRLKFFNYQSSRDSISSFPSLTDIEYTNEQAELLAMSKDKCLLACSTNRDYDGTNLIENKNSKSKICECLNCTSLPTLTECGLCLEPLQGYGIQSCPICSNLICGSCASRLTSCAFCRTALPMQRNRAIERLLDKLILPCKNRWHGCEVRLNVENRFEHEAICNFSLIMCPHGLRNCRWRGSVGKLESHMTTVHQLEVLQDFGVNVEINDFRKKAETLGVRQYSVCLSCYNQLFYTRITIFRGKLKLSVIKLGYTKKIPVKSSLPKYGVMIKIDGSCKSMKGFLPFEKNLYDIREIVIKRRRLYSNTNDIGDKDLVRIDLSVKEINNSS